MEKLSEAEHFLSKMKTYSDNPSVFPYYVSAFLAAFYSVQDHVQNTYNENKKFKAPIRDKLDAFQTKKIVRELNALRTTETHRKSIPLEYEVFLKPSSTIRASLARLGYDIAEDGSLKGGCYIGDGERQECPLDINWTFPSNPESDVASICSEGFSQLCALVSEVKNMMDQGQTA